MLCISMFLCLPCTGIAQCNFTEANLTNTSGSFTIPAGKVLCINSNYCLGPASNFPGACPNNGPSSIIINGILRVAENVTFRFQGTISGNGKIQLLRGARMSMYGTIDCSHGLQFLAAVPIWSPHTLSTAITTCSSPACEPKFPTNYAPFGVIANGLGYNTNGCTAIVGYPGTPQLLPNTLIHFIGSQKEQFIRLSWETTSEQDNEGFDVQESYDGNTWQQKGHITSMAPGGTSNSLLQYSFLLPAPTQTGPLYFRLVQRDTNGIELYSEVVTIKIRTATANHPFFLSAAPGQLQVSTYSTEGVNGIVKITTIDGRLLSQTSIWLKQGYNNFSIPSTRSLQGLVFVSLQSAGNTHTEKIYLPSGN